MRPARCLQARCFSLVVLAGQTLVVLAGWTLVVLAGASLALLAGCTGKRNARNTPEAAFEALTEAARGGVKGAGQIYDMLDEGTQWSVISVHKDRRRICALIEASYPAASRARELRRCSLAARAKTTRAWFAAYARRHRLLAPLGELKRVEGRSGGGERVILKSGGRELAFCSKEQEWFYCGLREHFEQQKVKADRDLTTVTENVEAYKRGGR